MTLKEINRLAREFGIEGELTWDPYVLRGEKELGFDLKGPVPSDEKLEAFFRELKRRGIRQPEYTKTKADQSWPNHFDSLFHDEALDLPPIKYCIRGVAGLPPLCLS